ncbi:type II toxin-antitoxin system RelE/ParE family toxin [Helicobacter pylori]
MGSSPTKDNLIEKGGSLKPFPDFSNIKALTNHTYEYRYRVGDYRVFFNIVGNTMNIVSIEEVKKRDERTY